MGMARMRTQKASPGALCALLTAVLVLCIVWKKQHDWLVAHPMPVVLTWREASSNASQLLKYAHTATRRATAEDYRQRTAEATAAGSDAREPACG